MVETICIPALPRPVSRLAFGTWHGTGQDTFDPQRLAALLSAAFEQGITLFDSAPVYADGAAEKVLGTTLKGHRHDITIASKFWFSQSSPDKIRRSLEASLRRLNTDYIDIYQQHWPSNTIPLADSIAELIKLKAEGKILAIGVCNWLEPEWSEIEDPGVIDVLQPCYNLLWRTVEPTVLPLCQKHSIAVLPYSPLAQGLLHHRPTALSASRAHNQLFGAALQPHVDRVISVVHAIARERKVSPAQVALRWVLENPTVTAPIVGASSPAQIEDLCRATTWRLTPAEHQALNTASERFLTIAPAHQSMWGFHPRSGRT